MRGTRLFLVGLLVAVVLASTGCEEYTLFELPVTVTCKLAFEDENDATEQRWDERVGGDYYSMPMDGGEVILLLGAQADSFGFLGGGFTGQIGDLMPGMEGFPIFEMLLGLLREQNLDVRMGELWGVTVKIHDRENPDNVLYEFTGDVASFLNQPDIQIVFANSHSVLIKKYIEVDPGETWWMGRMEVWGPEGVRSHDDTYLIMGGLAHWMDNHNGSW